jgi:hypothetical protein
MNGYKAFWNGKQCDVHADSSYAASTKATAEFQKTAGRKKVKPGDVRVVLCEKDNTPIVHTFSD